MNRRVKLLTVLTVILLTVISIYAVQAGSFDTSSPPPGSPVKIIKDGKLVDPSSEELYTGVRNNPDFPEVLPASPAVEVPDENGNIRYIPSESKILLVAPEERSAYDALAFKTGKEAALKMRDDGYYEIQDRSLVKKGPEGNYILAKP